MLSIPRGVCKRLYATEFSGEGTWNAGKRCKVHHTAYNMQVDLSGEWHIEKGYHEGNMIFGLS